MLFEYILLISHQHDNWTEVMSLVKSVNRNLTHSSTGISPFQAVSSYHPSILPFGISASDVSGTSDFLQERLFLKEHIDLTTDAHRLATHPLMQKGTNIVVAGLVYLFTRLFSPA